MMREDELIRSWNRLLDRPRKFNDTSKLMNDAAAVIVKHELEHTLLSSHRHRSLEFAVTTLAPQWRRRFDEQQQNASALVRALHQCAQEAMSLQNAHNSLRMLLHLRPSHNDYEHTHDLALEVAKVTMLHVGPRLVLQQLMFDEQNDDVGDDELHQLHQAVRILGLESSLRRAAADALESHVERVVDIVVQRCGVSRGALRALETWLKRRVWPKLLRILILHTDCHTNEMINEERSRWKAFGRRLVLKRLGRVRLGQLFELIIEWPDSRFALEDLRASMGCETGIGPHQVAQQLSQALNQRLLHAGAMTRDILTQYVASSAVLQHLDASGLALSIVARPVAEYLRARPDTVRCAIEAIVQGPIDMDIIDDKDASRAEDATLAALHRDSDLDEEDEPEGHEWHPGPPRHLLVGRRAWRGDLDQIGRLVQLFATQVDAFAEEYRVLLAERLIAAPDEPREIRLLELLKLRFGETPFQYCDVMLRDVTISRRLQSSFKSSANAAVAFNALIVSKQFWPPLPDGDLKLPTNVRDAVDSFTTHFELVKKPRKLSWMSRRGHARIEITMDDGRIVRLRGVSPIHTALLYAMDGVRANEWISLKLIAERVGVNPADPSTRTKIQFWVHRGVLRESLVHPKSDPHYSPHATADQASLVVGGTNDNSIEVADEEEDRLATAQESSTSQRLEYVRQLDAYICGLVPSSTFAGGFSLQQIDNILRGSFLVGGLSYKSSLDELQSEFLERLVAGGKLECIEGLYRRRATNSS